MAVDHTLLVRRAVLVKLKNSPAVVGLVPASNIWTSTVPPGQEWPFIRYGVPLTSPFLASGLDSSSVRVRLHAFTKGAPTLATAAEDHSYQISAAISGSLGGRTLDLETGLHAKLAWLGSNCEIDGSDRTAWHAVVNFTAEVAG